VIIKEKLHAHKSTTVLDVFSIDFYIPRPKAMTPICMKGTFEPRRRRVFQKEPFGGQRVS